MVLRLIKLMWRGFRAVAYFALGILAVLVGLFVVYMDSRPDLDVWHLAELDEEFKAGSKLENFEQYLALEERLFRQLDDLVYARIKPQDRHQINRYNRGSLSDPVRWSTNWNRSFVLPATKPKAGVLLLHGMSDSPYSLRHLGQRLNEAGGVVVGLRVPGHGTAPSGLVHVTWQDMAAAVRLAMRHLKSVSGSRPLYIIGYSNGAALAVHYALSTLDDESLPQVNRLVVLSPEIGVTRLAALSVWQSRLGRLLGLDKLVWNEILPEYDPFKYGSFAVNAGDVVYRLTHQIQQRITTLTANGKLGEFPPVLAFSSVVDATVSTSDLIADLFERLPVGGHELVLFDINHKAELAPILKWDPAEVIQTLHKDSHPTFTFKLVTNKSLQNRQVIMRTRRPGQAVPNDTPIGLLWPDDVYSLAHVALPFPAHDPLYGGLPGRKSPGIRLGSLALRGERGILRIPPADLLRLRWNPFYPYVEAQTLNFLNLNER